MLLASGLLSLGAMVGNVSPKWGRAARMDGPPDRRGRGEGMTRKPLAAPYRPPGVARSSSFAFLHYEIGVEPPLGLLALTTAEPPGQQVPAVVQLAVRS